MIHCTSRLFCTFFPEAVCFKSDFRERSSNGILSLSSNSSVSTLKKKLAREEVCETQCSCKFISSTFRLWKHCCFWEKKKCSVLSVLSICIYKGGSLFPLGLHPWHWFQLGVWVVQQHCCWKVSVIVASFTVEEYVDAESSSAAKNRAGSLHSLAVVRL